MFLPEILFCFGSKIRRNGQESLFWESLYLTRKRHLYSPQGRIQKIQTAVAGKLASYMYSFHFAALIEKITQKLTGKKVGERWRGHGPLGHPLNPRMVPMRFYNPVIPMVIRQHSSISYILSIPNLDSIFFPFPTPQCSPFKYLSLWLLNPQSLPSNEASPGSQKTY